jgi:hypothetical protein
MKMHLYLIFTRGRFLGGPCFDRGVRNLISAHVNAIGSEYASASEQGTPYQHARAIYY